MNTSIFDTRPLPPKPIPKKAPDHWGPAIEGPNNSRRPSTRLEWGVHNFKKSAAISRYREIKSQFKSTIYNSWPIPSKPVITRQAPDWGNIGPIHHFSTRMVTKLRKLHPSLAPVRTDVFWYKRTMAVLDQPVQNFYADTIGLCSPDLDRYVSEFRQRAWSTTPEPFFGSWWFLRSSLACSSFYPEILRLARAGASILDMACGFGHELRWLRYHGARGEIHASDPYPELWKLGLEFFKDIEPPATFYQHDLNRVIESSYGTGLTAARRNADIIMLNSFLHLTYAKGRPEAILGGIMRFCKIGARIVGWTFGTDSRTQACPHWSRGNENNTRVCPHWSCGNKNQRWDYITSQEGRTWDVEEELVELKTMGMELDDWSWTNCCSPVKALFFMATRVG